VPSHTAGQANALVHGNAFNGIKITRWCLAPKLYCNQRSAAIWLCSVDRVIWFPLRPNWYVTSRTNQALSQP